MAEIVQGLFGVSPESLNAQREQALQAQALQYAQLDPSQQAQMGFYQAGSRLGTGIAGLMGAQDPEMQRSVLRQQLLKTADTGSVQGLQALAASLQQQNDPQGAMQALQKAQELAKSQGALAAQATETALKQGQLSEIPANIKAKEAQAAKAGFDQLSEEQAQAATKAALIAEGMPLAQVEAIIKNPKARESYFSKVVDKTQVIEANGRVLLIDKATGSVIQNLGAAAVNKTGSSGIQQEIQQQRLEDLKIKAAEKQQATMIANQGRTASFDAAIDTLSTLMAHPGKKDVVGKLTGSAMAVIPGTDAAGFAAQLETFKAQSFLPQVAALKGMGALSDAEGKKLTDAVGALSTKMKPAEFDAQVAKITNDLKTARNRVQATTSPGTPATPVATKRWNPQTQKLEVL